MVRKIKEGFADFCDYVDKQLYKMRIRRELKKAKKILAEIEGNRTAE